MSKVEIGRNDPCPCNSGLKFKKCCMGKKPVRKAIVLKTISPEITIGTTMVEEGLYFVKEGAVRGRVPHVVTDKPFGKARTVNAPNFYPVVQVENLKQWFRIVTS